MRFLDIPDEVRADLLAEERARRDRERKFRSGLNCRDPEHWGCPNCEPELFYETEENHDNQ